MNFQETCTVALGYSCIWRTCGFRILNSTMARQQTLTKFLTNSSRPSVLRTKKQTRMVLDSDSSLNVAVETDSDVPVTHLTQNPASRCTAVSSPPSNRTRSASPVRIGSSLAITLCSDGDSPGPAKRKRKRKLNKIMADSDSEDELPHKHRRFLQRGLRPDKDEEDDQPDHACKGTSWPV